MTQIRDIERSPGWWFAAFVAGMSALTLLAAIGFYTVLGWLVTPASLLHWMLCIMGGMALVIGLGLLFWAITDSLDTRGGE